MNRKKMCIYIYIYMCICVYVYVYVYVYAYVYDVCMCVCVYVCVYACMHACMDAWIHGCMNAWMHGCMDTWMDGCMHACMHVWYTPSIVDGKIAYEIWCLSNIYTHIMHHSRSLCVLYVVYVHVYLSACRRVLWIVVVMSTRMNKPGFIN